MNKLIQTLLENRKMGTRKQVELFEEAVAALAEDKHPELLEDLFLVFTDETEMQEVMWGLLHYIESHDLVKQVDALINSIAYLHQSANEWLKILMYRILNNSNALRIFHLRCSSLTPTQRNDVKEVLSQIVLEAKEFEGRIRPILKSI